MDIAQFVGETTMEMVASGIRVTADPGKFIHHSDGTNCSGWFDPAEKEFMCATGRKFWPETWAHEYGHFTQWKDGVLKEEDEDEVIWDWLGGKDFIYEDVAKSVRASQDLESDNERRTVKIIEKYGLPIDIPSYTQKSNAYLLFYDVVLKTRRWADGDKPAYSVPEIYSQLPSDHILNAEEYRDAPQWFFDLVRERCTTVEELKPWERIWRAAKRRFTPVYDPA
jgi:hypothetical protein